MNLQTLATVYLSSLAAKMRAEMEYWQDRQPKRAAEFESQLIAIEKELRSR